jgi:hypothetical protein
VIGRVLPSISWLSDTSDAVIQFPDEIRALADRVEKAAAGIPAMQTATEPGDVVVFMTMLAERRGMELPSPALLALDAQTIAATIPADLWPVACFRIWSAFAYRRLPECSDFRASVADELRERAEAVARLMTAHAKVARRRWLDAEREKADARHCADKTRERARRVPQTDEPAAGISLTERCVSGEGGHVPSPVPGVACPAESRANPSCDRKHNPIPANHDVGNGHSNAGAVQRNAADLPCPAAMPPDHVGYLPPRSRSVRQVVSAPSPASGIGDGFVSDNAARIVGLTSLSPAESRAGTVDDRPAAAGIRGSNLGRNSLCPLPPCLGIRRLSQLSSGLDDRQGSING